MAKSSQARSRSRDRIYGLAIIIVAFACCMAVSLWGKEASTPKPAPDPLPPTAEGLPGFPEHVRPLELVHRARTLSVRTLLQGFVADGVNPDGTMDFTKPDTMLRFSFQSPEGIGPQPLREGGTLPRRTYCGKQSVQVGKHGIAARPDMADVGCPRRGPRDMRPPEKCSVEQLWKIAKKRRFKMNAPARIEFYWSKAGPAYRFVQKQKKGASKRFSVSARDCKKILNGTAQRGSVP